MKKLLLLLVGCVVAFAAGAQDYSNWYLKVPCDANGNNEYDGAQADGNGIATYSDALAIGTDGFRIQVWNGTSNTWYHTSEQIAPNTWTALTAQGSKPSSVMHIKGATSGETFTVKFNCATKEVMVTSQSAPVTDFKTFYLVGNFNNWTLEDANYKFETTDGKVYTLTAASDIKKDGVAGQDAGFKINEGNWTNVIFGKYDDPKLDEEFKLNTNSGDNIEIDIPANATITLTYNVDGTSTLLIKTKTVVEPASEYIYMHFKYDLEVFGKDGVNTIPYCQYYNTDNSSVKSDYVAMTLESSRYSIWKAPLSEDDNKRYNAVRFSFAKNSTYGGGDAVYDSYTYSNVTTPVVHYDKANWAKFVYATASDKVDDADREYAAQTYLTYARFKELDQLDIDNGGRRNLYLIGWKRADDATFDCYDEVTKQWTTMSSDLSHPFVLTHDGGCFYLPIKVDGGRFKISWISLPNAESELGTEYGFKHPKRQWATFDLGLIGVDKDYVNADGTKADYTRDSSGGNGEVKFTRNRSVRYMNYNQADWVLPGKVDYINDTDVNGEEIGYRRWLVVDTHVSTDKDGSIDEAHSCKTATITSFDPNPSVEVEVSEVVPRADELDDATAKEMHVDCLNAAEDNGHVYMKNVNYAVGQVKINATNIAYVNLARYSREYTLYVNDNVVGTHSGENLENLRIDYFPLSYDENGNSISVRAKYTDSNTGLSFHSRTGKGDVETDVRFDAPLEKRMTGRYVCEGYDQEGKEIYGIYVEGLDCEIDNPRNYHAYSDFKFDCGSVSGFVDGDNELHKLAPELIPAWEGWSNGQDWSTKLRAERTLAPVFIHDVVRVDDFSMLDEITVTCTVYAVYPFMYNPNATFKVNETSASAPARAADAAEDFTGFHVYNSSVPRTMTFSVTPDNAISGVEEVGAEDAHAHAPVEYYTVSGVRVVGEPAPGIYVRVQGAKAEKVVIR